VPRNYLAFDIEIAKDFPDIADWRRHRPLGITCAATLAADEPQARLWHGLDPGGGPADRMSRDEAAGLVEHLEAMVKKGYTIATWNGLGFDFEVLAEESGRTGACKRLARGHVDMMFHVFCALGFPVGLDAAARGMRIPGKPEGMSGVLAPQMWAQGKRREVLDYVAGDVRTTLELARAGDLTRTFHWITRRGQTKHLALPHGWLDVPSALKLPEPDTSWMRQPTTRRQFTRWVDS